MDYNSHTFDNGIRIAHLPYKSDVAYCGLVVNCGSADEEPENYGIVHFIEHMLFKGTQNRKNWQILNRLDNVGGELNAYTTKEETFVYATFPKQYFSRATELLTDIVFNSTFPESEVTKEREVIVDEINSYKDSPYESIYDDFEDLLFADHPLGHNILGTKKSLKKIKQKQLVQFINEHYYTNQIVFFVMGDFSFNAVLKKSAEYLEGIGEHLGQPKRIPHTNYKPQQKQAGYKNHQTHCMLGNLGYDLHHNDRLALYMLNNLIGGPAMNSRLNMSLREKHGIAYNIESSYTAYSDTGIWSIYFGTDERNLEKSLRIINKELRALRENALSATQLEKVKKQLIGQLCISHENKENHFLNFGKSILHFNSFESMPETIERIQAITSEQFQAIAIDILNPEKFSSLVIK